MTMSIRLHSDEKSQIYVSRRRRRGTSEKGNHYKRYFRLDEVQNFKCFLRNKSTIKVSSAFLRRPSGVKMLKQAENLKICDKIIETYAKRSDPREDERAFWEGKRVADVPFSQKSFMIDNIILQFYYEWAELFDDLYSVRNETDLYNAGLSVIRHAFRFVNFVNNMQKEDQAQTISQTFYMRRRIYVLLQLHIHLDSLILSTVSRGTKEHGNDSQENILAHSTKSQKIQEIIEIYQLFRSYHYAKFINVEAWYRILALNHNYQRTSSLHNSGKEENISILNWKKRRRRNADRDPLLQSKIPAKN